MVVWKIKNSEEKYYRQSKVKNCYNGSGPETHIWSVFQEDFEANMIIMVWNILIYAFMTFNYWESLSMLNLNLNS
jgi:hypothetical protein